ncbi:MAG: hypothetical protein R3C03_07835 [Pirellulaceae bacterium]
MQIQQRHTLFSKTDDVCLDDNGIYRQQDGRETKRIAFADITGIQLLFEGHSQAHHKTVCRCVVRAGHRSLTFSNALFGKSPPEMDAQYIQMTEQLHKRLPPGNQVTLRQGSNVWYLMAWIGIASIVLGGLLIAAVLLFDSGSISQRSLIRALAVVGFSGAGSGIFLPLLKRGRAKSYSRDSLPSAFLPS